MWRFWLFLGLSLFFSTAYAERMAEPLEASQAFHLTASLDDHSHLLLDWQIAPGYFLYRDKVQVSPMAISSSRIGDWELPDGKVQEDEIHGVYQAYHDALHLSLPILSHSGLLSLSITYQGCSGEGFCYAPMKAYLDVNLSKVAAGQALTLLDRPLRSSALFKQDYATALLEGQQYLWIVLGFMLIGLLLAFTPCVLPMIPILSSLIVGYGKSISTLRAFTLSLAYVIGMSLAYSLAGVLIALVGNHIQIDLQKPWVIIVFSGVFVLLALSMFDWYELRLPNRFQKIIHRWSLKHEGGTHLGVFLMGALSTLIVSPCVSAPLVGVLAYIGNSGDVFLGGIALLSLGLGMGFPLLLVGTSAGKLMPKTGSWMHAVKSFFGLILLGVAIWIVSRILPGTITLFLWGILVFASVYFIRKIALTKRIWRTANQGLCTLLLAYALVLVVGSFAGESDPFYLMSHSLLQAENIEKAPFTVIRNDQQLAELLGEAKKNHQPVLIDFYADWCVSCLVMDKHVFTRPEVLEALNHYVLLRADVTENSEFDHQILSRFHVIAPPTLVFFNASGEALPKQTMIGEMNGSELISTLKRLDDDHLKASCLPNTYPC